MSEQTKTRLKTALGVTITTVAPNDRGEVAVRLVTYLRPEEPFEVWLTAVEARDLAGQLHAQAEALLS